MRIFTVALIFLLLNGYVLSQTVLPDYSKLPSVVYPPASYKPSPNGTSSTVIVSPDGYDNIYLGIDFGEPHIAVNPRDLLNSVTAYNINEFYYTLNGIDWFKKNVSFPGNSAIGDPVLTYDSIGNVYYLQMYQIGSLYGGYVAKSTNKGVDFSQVVSAYSFNGGLGDKPWICADQTAGPYSNNIYVGWRQFGSSGMRFVRSTNGGLNWSNPIALGGDQGAYVSVGANGNISGGSLYFACTSGSSIRIYKSTDGGATFGGATNAVTGIVGPGVICAGRYTVKNCIRCDYFPRMSADNSFTNSRGNVYIVYAARNGSDPANILFTRSTNGGAVWTTPVKINDDATLTDQWMPAIHVDNKSGKIFVSWYDSRNDPTGNLMTEIYGTYSTNGGVSFVQNYKVSNSQFNPNSMGVGQPGGENYIGDYHGISTVTNSTALSSFMDSRAGGLGSYIAYGPDFAMKTSITEKYVNNNDSGSVWVSVPSVKGGFDERVKFTISMDTLPQSGNIQINFTGKDSVINYPDSVKINFKTIGNVSPGLYYLKVIGKGVTQIPIHRRYIKLIVNSSYVDIGTNRNTIAQYSVNNVLYTTRQSLLFANGSIVNIKAFSPLITGSTKYTFTNWSDAGDTSHNITVNSPLSLTAFYKASYKLLITSTVGNTFGGNIFYDSAVSFTFGVNSRTITSNGINYVFKGWQGTGANSYTSADSSGIDSAVTISLKNPILETARWMSSVGVINLTNVLPADWKLYQNYPNPFNPVTNIKFDIKENSFTEISVYDISGRNIKNLVSDKLSAGKYEIHFDASGLASGIYFYSIKTNNFTDIKKMILIK